MAIKLNPIEARVLGCLIEKELTTPEYYPISRNSLVAACNQKSNRDPVMMLTESDVEHALETLRYDHRLVAQVTLSGSRVVRFRHELLTHFKFSPEETAVMCELLLRGAQTAGELRTHTQRIVAMDSPAAVKSVLQSLTDWDETAFVKTIPPSPGKREERYTQTFCETEDDALNNLPAQSFSPQTGPLTAPPDDRIAMLEEKLAALDARLAVLENALL
jgi:uncharacterized protein YceH (UPF0502 family)